LIVPINTIPITACQAPGVSSSVRAKKFPAALLTKMSSGPSLSSSTLVVGTHPITFTGFLDVSWGSPVALPGCPVISDGTLGPAHIFSERILNEI
jgi:hypothetical protein